MFPESLPLPRCPRLRNKSEGLYHTVGKNETLWRICKTYKVSIQEVAELNNIKNPARIKVGDKLFIPGARQQLTVKASQQDGEGTSPGIVMKKGIFIWPVKGPVITQFGIDNGFKNDGIDIAVAPGSSVVAAYDGQVVFSSDLKGYGKTIIIQHRDKYATVYANNKTNLAKKGDAVKTRQMIATTGRLWGRQQSPASSLPDTRNKIRREIPSFICHEIVIGLVSSVKGFKVCTF